MRKKHFQYRQANIVETHPVTNRMTTRLDEPAPAEAFDDALRWIIPSRTNPNESYVVELNDAPGYDVCQCPWFVTTLGPLLARGVTPEQAVAEKLVKIKKHERVEDALKCFHVREANYRYGQTCKRLMCRQRVGQLSELKKQRHAPSKTPLHRSDLRAQAEDLGPSPRL